MHHGWEYGLEWAERVIRDVSWPLVVLILIMVTKREIRGVIASIGTRMRYLHRLKGIGGVVEFYKPPPLDITDIRD